MEEEEQFSQSLPFSTLLALTGGFMDAYSYLGHGKVFANGQTGNILLLGIHLFQGDFSCVLHYLVPILCFMAGIALSVLLHRKKHRLMHWKQHILLYEALILVAVSLLSRDILANSLTSLACGIQVQTFQKLHGRPIATTMCLGNLRHGTTWMLQGFLDRDGRALRISLIYFYIILCFIGGAVLGNVVLQFLHQAAILLCSLLLLASCLLLQAKRV